jgi:FkbM family methyltransferase
MILTTRTKVAAAGLVYRTIELMRNIVGKSKYATVERDGLKWCLDLSEGIDFSIYILGGFERATAATLRKLVRPGSVVFDIGANIGSHTLGLARSAGPNGRVLAIEPTDFAFAKLKRNLGLNPQLDSRTRSYQVLLTSDPQAALPAQVYASWPLGGDRPVHPKLRGRLSSTSGARVDTLDGLVEREGLARVDLIKIDVDGDEYAVLKGGAKTLARYGPTLVMELSPWVHTRQDFAALVELLKELGYSLQDASTWRPLPLRADYLEKLIPDGAGINAIARSDKNYNGERRA